MISILENPLELQAQSQYYAAEDTLSDARSVLNQQVSEQPRLRQQVDQLAEILARARTPVELMLYSDQSTQVEIYRVGKFDPFLQHAISLYPGKYTVVGTRSGYRDTRHELEIDGLTSPVELRITTTEKVR